MDNVQTTPWTATVDVHNNKVTFKLDTGADVNVFPRHVLRKWIQPPKVEPTCVRVSTYTDDYLPICGECILQTKTRDLNRNLRYLVVDLNVIPILRAEACQDCLLIQRLRHLDS